MIDQDQASARQGSISATNPIFGDQPFKLGLFTFSHEGGGLLTKVPERWQPRWDDVAATARLADTAGLDFMLPLSGWRGWVGDVSHRRASLEPLTLAATLAGITRRIGLFSTVAVPFVHPLVVAKMLTTIDLASHGRAGLNIVCSWSPEEARMFGVRPVAPQRRYHHAQQWYDILSGCLAQDADSFDYRGEFFEGDDLYNLPKPLQPRLPIFNAAVSEAGRDFARNNADFLLAAVTDLAAGRAEIDAFRAADQGDKPRTGVIGVTTVVCRPTRADAEAYNERYSVTEADNKALDAYLVMRGANATMPDFGPHERQRHAGGATIAGSPQDVADYFIAMHEAGYEGSAMIFVNFLDELPFFIREVLPLLERAGIRLPVTA